MGKYEVDIWGFNSLKDFLNREASSNLGIEINLKCKTIYEKEYLSKVVPELFENVSFTVMNSDSFTPICGTPFMMSLLVGEFDVARRLLDKLKNQKGKVTSWAVYRDISLANWERRYKKIYLEDLLYREAVHAPDDLRVNVFTWIVEEKKHLEYELSLKNVLTLGSRYTQQKIKEDMRKIPGLYSSPSDLYAGTPDGLIFLLNEFTDENCLKGILKQYYFGETQKVLWRNLKYDVDKRLYIIKKVTDLAKKNKSIRPEYFTFMLKALDNYKSLSDKTFPMVERIDEINEAIWESMAEVEMTDEVFDALLQEWHTDKKVFEISSLYEIYYRRTGKKRDFKLTNPTGNSVKEFFAVHEDGYEETYLLENANKRVLVEMLDFVNEIKYEDRPDFGWINYEQKIAICDFIVNAANEIKDFFPDLIEKGLIPNEECMDFVLEHVQKNKKCSYMIPFLLMKKWGAMKKYEG